MQRAVGNRKFNQRQRTALMELLNLRDHIAQTEDLPPRSVLKDDVCSRVAKDMPTSKDALLAIKHFPRPVVESWGNEVLSRLQAVREMGGEQLVGGSPREESTHDRSRIDALHAFSSLLCCSFNRMAASASLHSSSVPGNLYFRLLTGTAVQH